MGQLMLLPAWEKPQERTEMLLPAVGGRREGGRGGRRDQQQRIAKDCLCSYLLGEQLGRGQGP